MSQQFELLYLEKLASSRRKNSRDIIEEITNSAFPSLSNADDEKFNDMYIYTASVCDIILNPNCPTLEISKPEMELRLEKFRVSIDFILLFKKLNLLIKIKIREHLMKKVKL